ncbi:MAG TPA: outer membrane beta-barrel protein [Anaeromyxobacter sp.]|nr:outer membrane beta-barrel protein [Anaeromyxobacter sp.]
MRTSIVRIVIAAVLLAGTARAAEESWMSYRPHQTVFVVNWEISGPIGGFSNYISDTSLRGISFEARSFVRDQLSLGLSFSWNRFDQTFDLVTVPVNTTSITNGTASGPVFRYADQFGIRGLAHYYLGHSQMLQPYLGVGIGGAWNYAYQQVADLTSSQSNFNFIVSPEVGAMIWLAHGASNAAVNIAFRYTYTTATAGREHDLQWLSGIVGLAWGY